MRSSRFRAGIFLAPFHPLIHDANENRAGREGGSTTPNA